MHLKQLRHFNPFYLVSLPVLIAAIYVNARNSTCPVPASPYILLIGSTIIFGLGKFEHEYSLPSKKLPSKIIISVAYAVSFFLIGLILVVNVTPGGLTRCYQF